MTKAQARKDKARVKALNFLYGLDSHTIYSEAILEELKPEFSVRRLSNGETQIYIAGTEKHVTKHFSTAEEIQDRINGRGKGGYVEDTDERLFGGYEIAETLTYLILGTFPGSTKTGLGFKFRECLMALERPA